MLGLAESKLLVVPRHFRGFDQQAMAERPRPTLPALRYLLVVGGDGDAAFEQLLGKAGGSADFIRPNPNEVIQVVYTSGTTGEPKGAMHTSSTLFSNVIPFAERLGLTDRDVVLMSSPMAHQTGFLYGMIMSLHLGARNVLLDVWAPERPADIIAAEGVTFTMASTPFLNDLTEVAQRRPEAFRGFRTFLAGGAPIPRVLARRAAGAWRSLRNYPRPRAARSRSFGCGRWPATQRLDRASVMRSRGRDFRRHTNLPGASFSKGAFFPNEILRSANPSTRDRQHAHRDGNKDSLDSRIDSWLGRKAQRCC
jgi:hypothetical protein